MSRIHEMRIMHSMHQLPIVHYVPTSRVYANHYILHPPSLTPHSTLGRADGRVYEAIFAAAQQEPLNATDVSIGYTRHLRDVLLRPMPGDNGSPPPLRPRL